MAGCGACDGGSVFIGAPRIDLLQFQVTSWRRPGSRRGERLSPLLNSDDRRRGQHCLGVGLALQVHVVVGALEHLELRTGDAGEARARTRGPMVLVGTSISRVPSVTSTRVPARAKGTMASQVRT